MGKNPWQRHTSGCIMSSMRSLTFAAKLMCSPPWLCVLKALRCDVAEPALEAGLRHAAFPLGHSSKDPPYQSVKDDIWQAGNLHWGIFTNHVPFSLRVHRRFNAQA